MQEYRQVIVTRVLEKYAQTGFTLVELLIVVVILAILAAVVIPQFSSTAVDAQEAALDANLRGLRAAIEVYKGQHGVYPGAVTAVSACATPGTGTATGAAGATASQAFIDQLALFSNTAGGTCTANVGAAFNFGPYLRTGIPNDPIGGTLGSLKEGITTTAAGVPLGAAAPTGGWAYDTVSGQIVMNSNALDSSKKAYSTH